MKCKICDIEIPQKRVDILKKYNKKITCVDCSDEEKLVAVNINATKENRTIGIVTQKVADEVYRVSKQGGVNYGTVN